MVARDIFFQGIAPPARLVDAERLLDLLPELAYGWPYRVTRHETDTTPFYEIRAEAGADRFICGSPQFPGTERSLDALNALCDLMAALAVALPQSNPRLICLHAAAVQVAGRLLIFPNTRRAGKSTLSVALSAEGHKLVGDDVVPLGFDPSGQAWVHALGITPRLRLPLPESEPLQALVRKAAGVENRQYRYVRVKGLPGHGALFGDPTFVILDRRDDPVPAQIDEVSADQAMDVLLFQNFTRDRHSGDVLAAIAPMLAARKVYRMTYHDLAGAVTCLEQNFGMGLAPDEPVEPATLRPFRLADLAAPRREPLLPGQPVRQRPGTVAHLIGDTLYLADVEGLRIHRMDPLAALIWELAKSPITPAELVEILIEAFPDTEAGQISADLGNLLTKWSEAGLILPVP